MNSVLIAERYLAPMTESDLDEVAAVERDAYEFPWTRGNFEDSLRNGYFGVCMRHVSGALIGYCVLMPVVDEMHLLNLCVAPAAQGRGVGLALLREAVSMTRARQLGSVLLEVRPSNLRATQLYERFGFAEIGRRKNYYPARHRMREDAIVMRYVLPAEVAARIAHTAKAVDTHARRTGTPDRASATAWPAVDAPAASNGKLASQTPLSVIAQPRESPRKRVPPCQACAGDLLGTEQERVDGTA